MAFEFSASWSYSDEPSASGDADATSYLTPPQVPPRRRGVYIDRKLRPGWWSFSYSFDKTGWVRLEWSMFNAAGLGDTSYGSSTDTTSGVGSDEWIVLAASYQDHPCDAIRFGIAVEYDQPGSITVSGVWLACPSCAEPV